MLCFRGGWGGRDVEGNANSGPLTPACPAGKGDRSRIDGRPWRRLGFSARLTCEDCGIEYPPPEPRLYSFNSPLGACPQCEGFGNVIGVDMDLVVPDANKSLAAGAIAPWNTPAYAHELEELLALAADCDVPVDVPFSQLTERQRDVVVHGVPEREFGGLDGFFAWLERRKYKMHVRVFLSRWRSSRPCPACGGSRLRPEALAARIGGRNIAEICAMQVREAAKFFRGLELSAWERRVGRVMLEQVQSRLSYLEAVGLDYLALDRTLRTLSGGEARRVALTAALGLQPGQHALRARRAFDRPPSARRAALGRRRAAAPAAGEHRRRRRARGGDDPRGGPGDRDRARGGRTRRPRRLSRNAAGNGALARQPHRRVPLRPPRRDRRGQPPAAQPRLDPHRRRQRQQPSKCHGRIPPRPALPGDGRERIGQEHARAGHALSGPLSPPSQRRPQAASPGRRLRRRADRRRRDGRSEPDRPLAAQQSGHLSEGVRRDSRRLRRHRRGPDAELRRRALQLQRRRRALRSAVAATGACRSTCSSSPTST